MQKHLGLEYEGTWVRNEMRGYGEKKMNQGDQVLGGYFENGIVNGKGLKKWRKEGSSKNQNSFYIYRGNLVNN